MHNFLVQSWNELQEGGKVVCAEINSNTLYKQDGAFITVTLNGNMVDVKIFGYPKLSAEEVDADVVYQQKPVRFNKTMKLVDFAEQMLGFAKKKGFLGDLSLVMLRKSQEPEFDDFVAEESMIQLLLVALNKAVASLRTAELKAQNESNTVEFKPRKSSSKVVSRAQIYAQYQARFSENGDVKIIDTNSREYQVNFSKITEDSATLEFRRKADGRAKLYGKINKYTKTELKEMCFLYLSKNYHMGDDIEIDKFMNAVSGRYNFYDFNEQLLLSDENGKVLPLPNSFVYSIVYFVYEIWKKDKMLGVA